MIFSNSQLEVQNYKAPTHCWLWPGCQIQNLIFFWVSAEDFWWSKPLALPLTIVAVLKYVLSLALMLCLFHPIQHQGLNSHAQSSNTCIPELSEYLGRNSLPSVSVYMGWFSLIDRDWIYTCVLYCPDWTLAVTIMIEFTSWPSCLEQIVLSCWFVQDQEIQCNPKQ